MKLWTMAYREFLGKLAKCRNFNVTVIFRKPQELFVEFRTCDFQGEYP